MSRNVVSVSSFIAMSLRRLPTFSPSAAHSFSTGRPFNFNGDDTQNSSGSGFGVVDLVSKVLKDSYCIRIDMPGLNSKDLNMWVDEKKDIRFEGRCKAEPKYDYKGWVYKGFIEGLPSILEMEQVKAELKHGVLWITLPLKEEEKERIRKEDLLEIGEEAV